MGRTSRRLSTTPSINKLTAGTRHGGHVNQAGGKFAELEKAREEKYFHDLQLEQLESFRASTGVKKKDVIIEDVKRNKIDCDIVDKKSIFTSKFTKPEKDEKEKYIESSKSTKVGSKKDVKSSEVNKDDDGIVDDSFVFKWFK